MPLKTTIFDASEFLDDSESQVELLADALETGDAGYIAHALGTVARARGMTSIAREAGITRKALYKALSDSDSDDSKSAALFEVIKALGMNLTPEKITDEKQRLAG